VPVFCSNHSSLDAHKGLDYGGLRSTDYNIRLMWNSYGCVSFDLEVWLGSQFERLKLEPILVGKGQCV